MIVGRRRDESDANERQSKHGGRDVALDVLAIGAGQHDGFALHRRDEGPVTEIDPAEQRVYVAVRLPRMDGGELLFGGHGAASWACARASFALAASSIRTSNSDRQSAGEMPPAGSKRIRESTPTALITPFAASASAVDPNVATTAIPRVSGT